MVEGAWTGWPEALWCVLGSGTRLQWEAEHQLGHSCTGPTPESREYELFALPIFLP